MSDRISIIIPVLNEERNLRWLLKELQERRTGFADEVIVVDGGSADNSVEVAEKLGAKVVIPGRKGRAVQMNAGAAAAKNGILYFLHADTLPPAGFDRLIASSIKNGAEAGCFTLRFDHPHPLLNVYARFTRLETTMVRFGDQSLFVKRDLFEKVGGFDESLVVMEDQKIIRELKRAGGFKLIREPVITSAHKYRENGVVRLQFIFTLIWAGYYAGFSQEVLTHIYRTLISAPEN